MTVEIRCATVASRDLIIALLRSKDLQKNLYEGIDLPDEKNEDEAKAAFLIKKNVSQEVFLVRNFSRPSEIWKALTQHYASTSKRNVQTRRRELSDITIDSFSGYISVHLQKKANAIDELTGLDIDINDSYESDSILKGLRRTSDLPISFFSVNTRK